MSTDAKNIFGNTFFYCDRFFKCFKNKKMSAEDWDIFCELKLGISAEQLGCIYQEGDTGVGGKNIDEYYANAKHAMHIPLDWAGASKSQLLRAIQLLHSHYKKCNGKAPCQWTYS